MHVVIIGAGLSGLAVAAALLKAGFEVTVIERDSSVGGLARSFTRNGYIFDIGPHIFFGKKILPKLREYFGGEEILIRNDDLRQGIYIRNKIFKYPFDAKEILYKIPKKRLLAVAYETFSRSGRSVNVQDGEGESLETWVKGKIGGTLFDYIELDTYVRKLYGISAAEISSDWGKHRLKPLARMTLWELLKRSFNPFAKRGKRSTFYCSRCIGEIADHLADFIVRNGGRVLLDTSIEGVDVVNGRVKEIYMSQEGKDNSISADFFVSSMRTSDLIGMITPSPGTAVSAASAALKYRNLVILYLMIKKPKILDYCLIYFSVRNTIFKRITEFKHFSREMMPENETTLALEICADSEDEIWNCKNEEIFERAICQLEELDVISRERVLEYFVIRVPSVYPVYFLHYEDHLRVVFQYLQKIKNLVCIGRQGLYQHDDMPFAIGGGFNVAGFIKSDKDNLDEVNRVVYEERLHRYDDIV